MSTLIKLLFLLILLSSTAYATDPPLQLYDEGVLQGTIYRLDCQGSGISCTKSGIVGALSVSGGGGASGWTDDGTVVRLTTASDNVGIGTTAPSNKLHIAGANDDGELISGNGAGNWAALIIENTSGTAPQAFLRTEGSSIGTNFFGVTRNNAAELFVQNNSSFIIGNLGNTPLIFGNNNTERMRLAAGGNLGIGTTNPRSKLELAGTLIITSGGSNAGTIGVGTSAPDASIKIRAGSAAASSAPLKLTSGTKMTTAESGAIEYNDDFLITPQADKRVSVCGLYNNNITQFDLVASTSETSLTSTTFPANFFNREGQKIIGDYVVSFGAAAGVTDRVRLYYDDNVIFDSTANAYTSGGAMFIHVDMVATQGPDHMNVGVSVTGSGIATTTWVTYNDFSSQSFASNTKILKVTGQLSSTLSGQMSLNHSQLMYCGPN